MGPESLKSALPPRWQPSRDCMVYSVQVEVGRDSPQLCGTLVLACLFFFWWPMTFFCARSGQLLAKVPRGPFSGHSHAHSLPTHSSHLLSLRCDLRPQLREDSAWSIFNWNEGPKPGYFRVWPRPQLFKKLTWWHSASMRDENHCPGKSIKSAYLQLGWWFS